MHIQSPIPNWDTALAHMPDGGLVLAVDQGDVLVRAKQVNPKIITALRHFVPDQKFPDTYAAATEDARHYFRSFIDSTYLERYLPYVNLIVEFNEFYDEGMALHDPAVLALRYLHATAFANVWNDEWRGKIVPASIKLVIGNSPVGNSIPIQFAQLAISTNNVLGYHPYQKASVTQWPVTVRDPDDWRYHSGRWHFNEMEWGLKPTWCFTETMPYMGSTEGWRHPTCLNGNQTLLVDVFRKWLVDVATTPAYREGRILGTGAWFTIGGGWLDYLLEAPQLVALADVARELWHPGTGDDDMDAVTKAKIREHATAIIALVDGHVWKAGDVALANTNPLITYTAPNGAVKDKRPPTPPGGPMVTYDLNVLEVTVDQLWLRVAVGLWVKVADVKLKGT